MFIYRMMQVVKDPCFRGGRSGGDGARRRHRMYRDLGELEGVRRLSAQPPLNPSLTIRAPLGSHVEISPI